MPETLMQFKVLNWNVAGAKYLELPRGERDTFKKALNDDLGRLIRTHRPDVVALQEVVQYESARNDIVEPIQDYDFHFFPLINTEILSVRAKWNKLEKCGGWPKGTYFAQGSGFLFRKDIPHQPVWSLPSIKSHRPTVIRKNYVEKVSLETGLYFGDRDSEPRAALVAHFVFNPREQSKPLDIFVVNLHLTTLTMEREGVPEIDRKATAIRLDQLRIVFDGIISRYNSWRRGGFRERGEHRDPEDWETFDRHEPVWILTGDFNATPESPEYKAVLDVNFMDVIHHKGAGTKAPGTGKEATLTLDYVFAGPKFISLHPSLTEALTGGNSVYDERVSDHFPMVASIPVWR